MGQDEQTQLAPQSQLSQHTVSAAGTKPAAKPPASITDMNIIQLNVSVATDRTSYDVSVATRGPSVFVAEPGVWKTFALEAVPTSSGTGGTSTPGVNPSVNPSVSSAQSTSVSVFVSNNMVSDGGQTGYKVGVIISAANGAVNIGPFWSYLDTAAQRSAMRVNVTSPILSGFVAITQGAQGTNKMNLSTGFNGFFTGKTIQLTSVN